ncbi:LOW QUALITY PROTEIN: hypothetical protein HID58_008197 [Brassica napus]|uniref:Inosine/uridine-preferring nucleoside hydrolase domain-containing protein n=1 Tax=Brassica napus TaxID=3708 RepID=A0ABQ8DP03_BRANA|nr:LOW QUALITY PROTEIN: hypothetical protein HID58_008197 [Brassica napus]
MSGNKHDIMATMMTKLLRLSTVSVSTQDATSNTLLWWEIAGYPDVPVTVGSSEPLNFVERVSDYLGKVTILSVGPLINLAIPIKRDSSLASTVKIIVIFGGAFFALGNINPPSEANIEHPLNLLSMIKCRFHIYGDPEAAGVGFISGADITVGINISTQLKLTGVCLHDPLSFVEAVRPDLFKYKKGLSEWGLREYASATCSWIKPSSGLIIKRKNHRWNRSNEQSMGEIFTNICGVDNKCRQSFGIYKVLVVNLNSNLNSRLLAKL